MCIFELVVIDIFLDSTIDPGPDCFAECYSRFWLDVASKRCCDDNCSDVDAGAVGYFSAWRVSSS